MWIHQHGPFYYILHTADCILLTAMSCDVTVMFFQEGLCAIIGTIRRGFEDLYEAKQILLFGDSDDCSSSDYGDDVQSRRSFYFGPASGQGFMGSGATQRRAIPKTSYGSRRASSNSLMTMARGHDKKNHTGYDGGGAGGLSGSHSGGYQTLRGPQRTPRSNPGGIGD